MRLIISILFLNLVVTLGNSQVVDLTSYLPPGHSSQGDVDYTQYLQKGINENEKVKMPNFKVLINHKGLVIPSNRTIYFQPNSTLKLAPSNTRVYYMIDLDNVEDVVLHNPRLEGDRQAVFGSKKRTGEWGMGIGIRSSKNIVIRGADLKGFWGDGIYLGTSKKAVGKTNQAIKIFDARIENARRNGISITNGNGVLIENVKISNTGSKSPGAAIDIEPNSNTNEIDNIDILNPHTRQGVVGILISLKELIGADKKSVNIQIEGHVDEYSTQAFRFAGFNKKMENQAFEALGGKIEVRHSTWKVGKGAFTYESPKNMFPDLIFEDLKLIKTKNGKEYLDIEYQKNLKQWLNKQPKMDVILK